MMNELAKLESFRYSLAVAESFDEIKLIQDATTSFAELARLQNLSLEKQNEVGKFRLEITAKIGSWLDENFPSTSRKFAGHQEEPAKMPVNKRESANSRLISRTDPEVLEDVITDIEGAEQVVTPNKVAAGIREVYKIDEPDVEVINQPYKEEKQEIILRPEIMIESEIPEIAALQMVYQKAVENKVKQSFLNWLAEFIQIKIQKHEKK